jgi:hypothetical protein
VGRRPGDKSARGGKTEAEGPPPRRPERRCPSGCCEPRGRPRREQTLPWDTPNVPALRPLPPARDACGLAFVYARAADASTSHDVGISGIVRTRSAGSWFVGGRTRSDNNSGASGPRCVRNKRRPNGNGENGGVRAGRILRPASPLRPTLSPRGARGHAAENILRLFATGRVVMNRSPRAAARRPSTAAAPVVRRCSRCWIGNANGCGATLPRVASNAASSIRPDGRRGGRRAARLPRPNRAGGSVRRRPGSYRDVRSSTIGPARSPVYLVASPRRPRR